MGSARDGASRQKHRLPRRLDTPENLSGVLEEDRSGVREAHATRRPHEERHSQLVLQLTDLAAYGRLGDVELPGGAADMALFGDGNEVLDLREAHVVQRNPSGGAQTSGFA
jgi:hypothetical protein